MSETTETVETQTQDAASQTDESKPAKTDWKAEARKWESRAKANHDAARQLAELQDAQRTDAEKLADARATIKRFEAAEQRRSWADEVSSDTGVPANLLSGDTLEAMRSSAEALTTWAAETRKTRQVIDHTRTPNTSDTTSTFMRQLFGRD
ncbi:MAG: hypothetical protein E7G59_02495 [Cutibacterium granulosum]|uniref:hypothetical protein n=1 Tax=Cutibacterium granulosum TaxID=33011 RepID=UPI002909E3BC|nr:hypothetical protein [Cutibacterium granulosum]MDU3821166.1 hypothetical protein [Cutibacterium granulosum]